MRVLAIGAHPDDLELLCGGTLARYRNDGHHVTMCNVSRGDRGSFVGTRDEVASTRLAEAAAAAAVIGADHLCLGGSDGEINSRDEELRHLATDAIREARPDLIITHAPNDYMTDHVETSRLVFDVSFMASVPLYATEQPHLDAVPALAYLDTVTGNDFTPTEWVDISETIDTKLDMLRCHSSQVDWLTDHSGIDLVDDARTVARFRGLQCGVGHAEAFAMCTVAQRARAHRLLP